ncbi:hypothetical protein DB346_20340 [Verrucomicrobia bacterium LW23]|nr:hypothetical protein DB346_20340 [Verrucomicrobia bacterium LW23]
MESFILSYFLWFWIIIPIIVIFGTILWLWMLIDCISNEPSTGNDKVVWLLVILLLQGFGALLYFFLRRPQRRQMFGK